MSMEFAQVASAQAVEMRPGIVRRSLVYGERMLLVHWELRAGVRFGEHSHPYEQAGYLLRGRLEMTIGGRRYLLRPGSSYVVASGVPHDAHVLEDSEVLDMFSPPREEYLPRGP